SITLNPDTRSLAFQTSPTGLQLTVGGVTSTTPFNTTVITNSRNTIAAPSPQSISGNAQTWANWSDGGAQNHDVIATPSTTGFTATYVSSLCGNGRLDPGEDCDGGSCCTALCHFVPNGSICNDGQVCTINDQCSAGSCVGTPAPDTD